MGGSCLSKGHMIKFSAAGVHVCQVGLTDTGNAVIFQPSFRDQRIGTRAWSPFTWGYLLTSPAKLV